MNTADVRLLARYNAQANRDMNKVLQALPPTGWAEDRGGFYPSIRALAVHLYTADLAWLGRFRGLRNFAALQGDPFDFPPAPGEAPFATWDEYLPKREALDARFEALAAELTEADLAADLTYRNFRGEEMTKNVGGLLLHIVNHQTHHRGMVALYLDQADIPNDYSNLLSLI